MRETITLFRGGVLAMGLIWLLGFASLAFALNKNASDCCYAPRYSLPPFERKEIQFIASAYNPVNGDLYLYDRTSTRIYRFKENGDKEVFLDYLSIHSSGILSTMQISPDGRYLFINTDPYNVDIMVMDIETKSVITVNEFRPRRFMISNSSIVTSDYTQYAIGGYGYWDYRNILLKWNKENPDIIEAEKVTGDIPSRGDVTFLYYLKKSEELYYLVHPMDNEELINRVDRLEFYRFSLSDKRWINEGSFDFQSYLGIQLAYHRFTGAESISDTYYHLRDGIFFKRQDHKIYVSKLDFFEVTGPAAAFYSNRLRKWILMAESTSSSAREVLVRVVDEEELNLEPIPSKEVEYSGWILLGVISVSFGLAGFIFHRLRMGNAKSEQEYRIVIHKKLDGPLYLYVDGEKISLSDPVMRRLWELIYSMKKESQSNLYLTDLDQHLFFHSSNSALNSRSRAKLFSVVEQMVGESIITIQKSATDKRYKIVEFDLSKVKLEEAG